MDTESKKKNKRKIINDPVHGFINIPSDLVFDLIEHPFLQRMRRIKQLGLTHYVFPGATHTRFQHTVGALHLMTLAIESLKSKNVEITREEEEAVFIAILLHDIGHGPFSHALEESIIEGISHEYLSELMMNELNLQFGGKLDLAIKIFNNLYSKKFLHQLVSSQLDMDRLDYISRDSFYTGVTEGAIGTDRIIKMLHVCNDNLVVEKKGIYSVEKFLIARRLMYWQVYFHKTVIASESLLLKTLQRAKEIAATDRNLYASPALSFFLFNEINLSELKKNPKRIIEQFSRLDDSDIMVSIKEWMYHSDFVLSHLADNLVNRHLPAVAIKEEPHDPDFIKNVLSCIQSKYHLQEKLAPYLLFSGEISNNAFSGSEDMIQISIGNDVTKSISEVSDILNILYLQKPEKKYFICYPKDCEV